MVIKNKMYSYSISKSFCLLHLRHQVFEGFNLNFCQSWHEWTVYLDDSEFFFDNNACMKILLGTNHLQTHTFSWSTRKIREIVVHKSKIAFTIWIQNFIYIKCLLFDLFLVWFWPFFFFLSIIYYFCVPNQDEKRNHLIIQNFYLWQFWPSIPFWYNISQKNH